MLWSVVAQLGGVGGVAVVVASPQHEQGGQVLARAAISPKAAAECWLRRPTQEPKAMRRPPRWSAAGVVVQLERDRAAPVPSRAVCSSKSWRRQLRAFCLHLTGERGALDEVRSIDEPAIGEVRLPADLEVRGDPGSSPWPRALAVVSVDVDDHGAGVEISGAGDRGDDRHRGEDFLGDRGFGFDFGQRRQRRLGRWRRMSLTAASGWGWRREWRAPRATEVVARRKSRREVLVVAVVGGGGAGGRDMEAGD